MKGQRFAAALVAAAWACGAAADALAQAWPSRPIRIVSGASVGSPGDVALRLMTVKMAAALGQPVVIDAQRGAGGLAAASAVARAEPDGHTIVFGNSGTFVTTRFLVRDLPVDSLKDLAPIGLLFNSPFVLVSHPSVPVASVRELIEYLKRNPGRLAYGTTGVGSGAHLAMEAFKQAAGVDVLHVPYTAGNSGLPINDIVAGRIQLYLTGVPLIAQYAAAGKVRMLALLDKTRSRVRPDIPTVSETLPDFYNIVVWYAFLGPPGLPRAIVDRLRAEDARALADAEVSAKIDEMGMSLLVNAAREDLPRLIASDIETIGRLARAAGLKPE